MVKVVSSEPHPSVVKQVVCRNCGTTLEYVPADRKQRQVSDYLGDKETVNYIVCPTCSHEVGV
jgi:DNA-directed RNA polymerase subunit RPC12/RpoP